MQRLTVAMLLAALPGVVFAQATGSLAGRVRDAQTEQPLDHGQVSVVGGEAKARTDDSGYFHLEGLPPGVLNVRIERDGYAAAVEQVDLGVGTEAAFRLFRSVTVLDALIVRGNTKKATAEGAATASVRPDEKKEPATSSATEMVRKVPGALILSGGQIGSGSIIRLRGVRSVLGSGPPLIYIDGVRVSGGEFRGGATTGGGMFRRYNEPSVLDQLDPASIDHIEVLPGSAATALYGTGGANGVILVFTKR